ncbi:MAG: GNAT family N-acetyltransferase [Solirubrobacteraceae bacterium]
MRYKKAMGADEVNLALRQATPQDEPFLRRMLWIAAHWRDPVSPPPQGALSDEHARYTEGFGRPGDHGVVATCAGAAVGAAWCRVLTAPHGGYGYVADDIPELSVAVLPDYRGRGIGGQLLERVLSDISGDFDAVSLSVEPANPARLLYERLDFVLVGIRAGSWTMVRSLSG